MQHASPLLVEAMQVSLLLYITVVHVRKTDLVAHIEQRIGEELVTTGSEHVPLPHLLTIVPDAPPYHPFRHLQDLTMQAVARHVVQNCLVCRTSLVGGNARIHQPNASKTRLNTSGIKPFSA